MIIVHCHMKAPRVYRDLYPLNTVNANVTSVSGHLKLSLDHNTVLSSAVTIGTVVIRLGYHIYMVLTFAARVVPAHDRHFVSWPALLAAGAYGDQIIVLLVACTGELRHAMVRRAAAVPSSAGVSV